ncbi:MAG: 50S ribosome-binding GTPase [Burkholderiaceae bacterium]|nr:50S ribosome-binding GTPase [Burkholderiaceae bacterium]
MNRVPVLALVGRPNVGKSTLFNRMTGSRAALVADRPGLTRDRHYGRARVGESHCIVIDTGGFEPVAKGGIEYQMARQARQAVLEADVVLFIVDGRQGLTGHDRDIAAELRKSARKLIVVVNKTEGMLRETVSADFHELGLGQPLAVSAAHGDGVRDLLEIALEGLLPAPRAYDDTGQDPPTSRPRPRAGAAETRAPRRRARRGGGPRWRARCRRARRCRGNSPGHTGDPADPRRGGRPPECRQEHADQHPAGRGAADRLRPARHHPRRGGDRLRKSRPPVYADRHRRRAPARQGDRHDREVLGREDAPGDRGLQRLRADARCDRGRGRAGRQHCRLYPRGGPRTGGRGQQVGSAGRPRTRTPEVGVRPQAALPALRQVAHDLGQERHGGRRTDAIGRRGLCGRDAQAAHAQAHPRAAGGCRAPAAAASRAGAPEASLCASRRAEPAHRGHSRQCAGQRARDVSALSRDLVSRAVLAVGHAAAHRVSQRAQSVRRQLRRCAPAEGGAPDGR